MDVGLYLLKYPFRKLISSLVPIFRNVNPNLISIGLIPVGMAMAYCYVLAFKNQENIFLWIAIALGFLRMIVATLDGLVAITYNKSSVTGDLWNRITPEVCDFILYPTLFYALQKFDIWALAVMMMVWAVTFFGLMGSASGLPVQSVGPCGQTDRLAALMLFSFLQILSHQWNWGVDFFDYFFKWLLIGGVITLALRLHRTLRAAHQKDQQSRG